MKQNKDCIFNENNDKNRYRKAHIERKQQEIDLFPNKHDLIDELSCFEIFTGSNNNI